MPRNWMKTKLLTLEDIFAERNWVKKVNFTRLQDIEVNLGNIFAFLLHVQVVKPTRELLIVIKFNPPHYANDVIYFKRFCGS